MAEIRETTAVPPGTHATAGGYPIGVSTHLYTLLRLYVIDVLSRVRFSDRLFARVLAIVARLSGQPVVRISLEQISRIRKLDVTKKSSGFNFIYTGRMARRSEKDFSPLYFVPGIRNQPVWDNAEFPWIKTLFEDNHTEIARELRRLPPPTRETFEMPAWGTYVLFGGGIENTSVTQRCPFTTALLRRTPRFCGIHTCVSTTRPGGFIYRHTGEGNWYLRVQLGLDIPDDRCYLEVAGEKIRWTEGKAFVFDDSYIHLVANPTDRPRTVLFFDFYHPDLTDADVESLSRHHTSRTSFDALTRMST